MKVLTQQLQRLHTQTQRRKRRKTLIFLGALPDLFTVPEFHSKPNHHFANHYTPILKFWGPLGALSEFAGERLNGLAQKTKHNRRVEISQALLTKVTRRGQLEAKLSDEQLSGGLAGKMVQILRPNLAAQPKALKPLTEAEVAKILAKAAALSDDDYLMYQMSKGQMWHNCYQVPHPPHSRILPPCARKPFDFKLGGHTFSCHKSHKGGSGIQFKEPGTHTLLTGFIDKIWEIPLEHHMQTFILVPHVYLK
ncbi:hypothetical protein C8R46DRAFT_1035855 [Mycena filopes]|nr:hypothetical protein C8R46DRAFT_1035855 [Mycena filopes]